MKVHRTTLRIDAEDLARAVLDVLDDPALAAAVVARAKELASLEIEFEREP